jgi:hypothetical protein
MDATFSSETSVDLQRTTQRYSPDDNIYHCCENLKYGFLKHIFVEGGDITHSAGHIGQLAVQTVGEVCGPSAAQQ